MSQRVLLRSFAGGEITPELHGRLDLTKYQTGLSLCRNMTVLPHGPVARRPGFRFRAETRDSTKPSRLVAYAYSAAETVVLEFGDQYIGFYVAGAPILEANQNVVSVVGNAVTMSGAHGWTTGDDVFIGGRLVNVVVTGASTFNATEYDGTTPVTFTGTPATAARVYRIASPYLAADLFALRYAQDDEALTITHPNYAARELKRLSATNWTLTTINFAPSGGIPTGVAVTPTVGTAGPQTPQSYVVTSIGADGVTESLASSVVSTNNALNLAGNYNTITWNAVVGATRYYVYKRRGGSFGFIGQTTGLSIVDDNVQADTTKTPPENIITLNDDPARYPTAVTYHEQRRWFANTTEGPQTVYATRSGTKANLTSSIPSQDDDGMEFRVAARQQNAIAHLVPLADLIALTVGGEFRIYADGAPAITPTSLSVRPQGYSGAANVQPAVTSGSILFVQSQGSRVRELAYNWQQQSYASVDMTIMAPHLFNGFTVKEMAFVRAPEPVLWVVRSDGALIGMTYVPEQQVYAWHRHDTDGVFESICAATEADGDILYAIVRRTVNGRTVRYVEQLASRFFIDQQDAFYVDSGLSYAGPAVTTLSGLYHLVGKTVQVLADGAVFPERVVPASGTIVLDEPASVVHVGLPYVSDFQTLPLAFEAAPAGGQGMMKNVSDVRVRVAQTNVLQAGPDFDRLVTPPTRDVATPMGSPPTLRQGEFRFAIPPNWGGDGAVCIRQDLPLPLTVLSMVLHVSTGG